MRRPLQVVSSLFAAAVLAIGVLPAIAEAQSTNYATVVWNQLQSAAERNRTNGGYGQRNFIIGRMDDDATDSWTVQLQGGFTYKVVGFCDQDCDDVDLEVYLDDKSIDSDLLVDDYPILDFTASSTGRYTIKVTMASCKANPCFWGIGILYK
jgi:hypothetical protein